MLNTLKHTFSILLALILSSTASYANYHYTGYYADSTKIDGPDFYLSTTSLGKEVKNIYSELSSLQVSGYTNTPPELSPIQNRIHKYILKNIITDPKSKSFYAGKDGVENGEGFRFKKDELAKKITKISFCFGFDPYIFSSLIKKESKFRAAAVSYTGAVGFTQLTGAGIKEVRDQFGYKKIRKTRNRNGKTVNTKKPVTAHGKNAPEIFGGYANCYLGDTFVAFPNEPHTTKDIKEQIQSNPDLGLIYGAVLFKLYLGHFGKYTTALINYNGDNNRPRGCKNKNKSKRPKDCRKTKFIYNDTIRNKYYKEFKKVAEYEPEKTYYFEDKTCRFKPSTLKDLLAQVALYEEFEEETPEILLEEILTSSQQCKNRQSI